MPSQRCVTIGSSIWLVYPFYLVVSVVGHSQSAAHMRQCLHYIVALRSWERQYWRISQICFFCDFKANTSSMDSPSKVCGCPFRSLLLSGAATRAKFGRKLWNTLHNPSNDWSSVRVVGCSSLCTAVVFHMDTSRSPWWIHGQGIRCDG